MNIVIDLPPKPPRLDKMSIYDLIKFTILKIWYVYFVTCKVKEIRCHFNVHLPSYELKMSIYNLFFFRESHFVCKLLLQKSMVVVNIEVWTSKGCLPTVLVYPLGCDNII